MSDLEFHPEEYARRRPRRLAPGPSTEHLEFHPEDYRRGPRRRRRRGWDLGIDLDSQTSLLALGVGLLAGAAALYYLKPQQRFRGRPRYRDSAPRQARRESDTRYAITGRAVTINKPRSELYNYWKDPKNFSFMENVERVEKDGERWRWTIKAPAGQTVSVVTRITEDRPNEYIAWQSIEDSQIETRGHVEFRDAPGGRGTAVSAVIEYVPPGGTIGQMVAKLFQREPQVQVRHDLKRLKMLIETGEIATSQNRKSE